MDILKVSKHLIWNSSMVELLLAVDEKYLELIGNKYKVLGVEIVRTDNDGFTATISYVSEAIE